MMELVSAIRKAKTSVLPPLHTVYLSNNAVDDEDMAKIVSILNKEEDLREMILIKQTIGE